jgi:hypothetical protein
MISLWISAYEYICMYVCIHNFCVFSLDFMCSYFICSRTEYVNIYIYIHIYVCIHIYIISACSPWISRAVIFHLKSQQEGHVAAMLRVHRHVAAKLSLHVAMNMYVRICTYGYTHTCVYTYTHACPYTHTHITNMHACIYADIVVQNLITKARRANCSSPSHTHTYTTCMHKYVCTHSQTHTHIHICTYSAKFHNKARRALAAHNTLPSSSLPSNMAYPQARLSNQRRPCERVFEVVRVCETLTACAPT